MPDWTLIDAGYQRKAVHSFARESGPGFMACKGFGESQDRGGDEKERGGKVILGLLKSLGVKGVSVTAPNYSMASSIDIRLPRRDDCVGADGYYDNATEGSRANGRVRDKFNEILARAFPRHDDRSDAQSDHFDFKFSIH